jgi:hypothetical protein
MATFDTGLGDMITTADTSTAVDSGAAVETPAAETTNNDVILDATTEHPEEGTNEDSTEEKINPNHEDGTPKTEAELETERKLDSATTGKEPLPNEVRAALKAFRDADPKNANIVKQLHGHFSRWEAAKELLGQGEGSGITGLKSFFDEVGAKTLPEARAAIARYQEMADSVKGADDLLHSGDPKLAENVLEDMTAQGTEKNYPKVVANFLSHLQSANPEGFFETIAPHVVTQLFNAGFAEAINSLAKSTDPAAVATANAIAKWFNSVADNVSDKAKVSRERAAWEAEKAEGTKAENDAAQKQYNNATAEACEKVNNTELGKALGSFFKLPFFKDFSYETKVDLGNGIKDRLYAALKADKQYQNTMGALWKLPRTEANKAKMVEVHTEKLRTIAQDIVTKTVQMRYPGYARGGSAAGKAAAAVVKKEAATQAARQSISTMKPIYVATRPTDLVRTGVKVGGKLYSDEDLRTLQISGKGFVKSSNGGLKFITWRKA